MLRTAGGAGFGAGVGAGAGLGAGLGEGASLVAQLVKNITILIATAISINSFLLIIIHYLLFITLLLIADIPSVSAPRLTTLHLSYPLSTRHRRTSLRSLFRSTTADGEQVSNHFF